MTEGIKKLRESPPKALGNLTVKAIEDYLKGEKRDLSTQETSPLTLPKSEALLFWLSDGSKLLIRPSGTEPKVKIYCGIVDQRDLTVEKRLEEASQKANLLIASLEKTLGSG